MRHYYTTIRAVHPHTGLLTEFDGPYIAAPSQQLAQEYCDTHEMGYVRVTEHWVVEEIEEDMGNGIKIIYQSEN